MASLNDHSTVRPAVLANHSSCGSDNKHVVRRRAPSACLACRARKVRCDAFRRGNPCTNCAFDGIVCVVTPRNRGKRAARLDSDKHLPAQDPSQTPGHVAKLPPRSSSLPAVTDQKGSCQSCNKSVSSQQAPLQTNGSCSANGSFTTVDSPLYSSLGSAVSVLHGFREEVIYSYYPFLTVRNLPHLLPQDVRFLEHQGCFRVPTRRLLDEFIQQYFLHVHPMLPLINEGDLWRVYHESANIRSRPAVNVSLLLFQAVIFASCNFVSVSTIRELGFPSIRDARAEFYRRTKLLYDHGTESSPVVNAQACLLLSLWSATGMTTSNSTWLCIAIRHARNAQAHNYSRHLPQHKLHNVLKRLWWCCIIRDRNLGLLLRRPVHITREHFDFETNSPLSSGDLVDEMHSSKVYEPEVKRSLAHILACLIKLYIVLADVITLVSPAGDSLPWGHGEVNDTKRMRSCNANLRNWYKEASQRFPHDEIPKLQKSPHEAVILYTNLLYMYYHSARIALCHHELAMLEAVSAKTLASHRLLDVYNGRFELRDAALSVTQCLSELIQLDLARWLPLAAVACTALPLLLNILDVKLSAPRSGNMGKPLPGAEGKSLDVLIQAMKIYLPQCDSVDWVCYVIQYAVTLAERDALHSGGCGDSGAAHDCTDILVSQPGAYLRVASVLDLSFRKGSLAADSELFTGTQNLSVESSSSATSPTTLDESAIQTRATSSSDTRSIIDEAEPMGSPTPPSHSLAGFDVDWADVFLTNTSQSPGIFDDIYNSAESPSCTQTSNSEKGFTG